MSKLTDEELLSEIQERGLVMEDANERRVIRAALKVFHAWEDLVRADEEGSRKLSTYKKAHSRAVASLEKAFVALSRANDLSERKKPRKTSKPSPDLAAVIKGGLELGLHLRDALRGTGSGRAKSRRRYENDGVDDVIDAEIID